MATGASNGQTNFTLTALDGKQDLPPGDHPLWIFDEGHAVRWLRTTEDRSALVEAGCQEWLAVTEAAKREERTEWLSERLQAASTEAVTSGIFRIRLASVSMSGKQRIEPRSGTETRR